jgi:type IV secretion system protein VirB10
MGSEGYDYSKWPGFLIADKGFDGSAHDPEVYSVAFRRGFKDGYENGFNNPVPDLRNAVESSAGDSPPSPESVSGSPDWIVPGGTRLIVRILDPLSTEFNSQGDGFISELAEDYELSEGALIREGTRIYGTISHLKRAGRIRGRAEMELQFSRIEISRGYSLSLNAKMVGLIQNPMRRIESEDNTITQNSGVKGDLGRIGASAGIGALIGVITGGGGGAGRGAVVGAAGGLVGTVITRGDDINLLSETEVVIRLADDLNVPKDRIVN